MASVEFTSSHVKRRAVKKSIRISVDLFQSSFKSRMFYVMVKTIFGSFLAVHIRNII